MGETIRTRKVLENLYALALALQFEGPKVAGRTAKYRDSLKKKLPAGLTAMKCLYFAGVLKINGREELRQVSSKTPGRIDLSAFLTVHERLLFTEGNHPVEETRRATRPSGGTVLPQEDLFGQFSFDDLFLPQEECLMGTEPRGIDVIPANVVYQPFSSK